MDRAHRQFIIGSPLSLRLKRTTTSSKPPKIRSRKKTSLVLISLPYELISMIFERCECQEDISNLRRACKRLADIGARHLVEWLHITFRAQSFDNLMNIARHPVLSKLVLHITYEADMLRRVDSQTWQEAIPTPSDFVLPPRAKEFKAIQAYKKKKLDMAWIAYQREMNAVDNVVRKNRDILAFSSSLRCFPNLEEVEVVLGGCSEDFLYDGDESETLQAAFKSTLVMPHLLLLQKNPEEGDLHIDRGFRQLGAVLRAAVSSGVKLKYLSFGTIDWSFFEAPEDAGAYGSNKYGPASFAIAPERYLPAFVHLRSLCIAIQPREDVWDDGLQTHIPTGGFPRAARLGEAMSAAQGLINLSLTLDDPRASYTRSSYLGPSYMGITTWDSIARQTQWPHLENFDLRSAPFSEEFFLDFLKRHSKTLQSLILVNIYLTTSTLPQFFYRLKGEMVRAVNLNEVDLSGHYMFNKVENDQKVLRSIDMSDEVDKDGCTIGMKISQYLLKDGEYPFDKDYWKRYEGVFGKDGSPMIVP